MGRFPLFFVPVCPLLSRFVPVPGPKQDKRGQTGTNGTFQDKLGNAPFIGNGPNTVSESTVSNTELGEFFALTEFRGENSVSSSQPVICEPKRTHRVFPRTHRVCPKTQ